MPREKGFIWVTERLANANANAVRETETGHVFGSIVDGDTIQHDAGAEGEMPKVRRARWRNPLTGTHGNAVSIEPGVSELGADTRDHAAMTPDGKVLVLFYGDL